MVAELMSSQEPVRVEIAAALKSASGGGNPAQLLFLDEFPQELTHVMQRHKISDDRIFAALRLATPVEAERYSDQSSVESSRAASPAQEGAATSCSTAGGSATGGTAAGSLEAGGDSEQVGSKRLRTDGGLDPARDPAITKDMAAEERQMVMVPPDLERGETSYKAEPTGRRAAAEANQALAEARTGTDVYFFAGSTIRDYDGQHHPQATSAVASTPKEKGDEEDEMKQ